MSSPLVIDVAVLCHEYSIIDIECDNHIVHLDDIPISEKKFKNIFYPHGENFGIDKKIASSSNYNEFISFLYPFRKVNGKPFYLLEEIIKNIENDLNLSRNCFTPNSLLELTNELSSITTLCDMNYCSVLSSLPWTNVESIVLNKRLLTMDINPNKNIETPISNVNSKENIVFVVSIVFKTPTPGVKNTIIKFPYKITNLM